MLLLALDTEGKVVHINSHGCELLGYTAEEIIGKNWFENFLPEKVKRVVLAISRKILQGKIRRYEYFENPVLTKYGEEKMIAWHNAVLKDKCGKIIGHIGSGEDISRRNEKKVSPPNLILENYKKKLKNISRKMQLIREEENKKLAIDLHDEIGSMAVNLGSKLNIAERKFKKSDLINGLKCLKQAKIELDRSLAQLKNISAGLRPPQLEIFDIEDILKTYISDVSSRQDSINIDFFENIAGRRIDKNIAVAIYRILQEALSNVIKHAEAANVKIKLVFEKDNLRFSIRDNGKGFDIKSLEKNKINFGIWGMKDRVSSFGGTFYLKSKPGNGTNINIIIPIKNKWL